MKDVLPFSSPADRDAAHRFFADRPYAESLFEALSLQVARLGEDVTLASTKSRVAFVRRTRFLWVHEAAQDGIWLGFLLPKQVKSARLRSGAVGKRWSHHVKVTAALEKDKELLGWVAQAYAADAPLEPRKTTRPPRR